MNKKDKLLSESFRLFGSKGYSAVPISEIVKAAGMTKGAFYYFFESKEALFNECVDVYILSYFEDFNNFLAGLKGTTREKLNLMRDASLNMSHSMEENMDSSGMNFPSYFSFMADSLREFDSIGGKLAGFYSKSRELIAGILEEGKNNGEVPEGIDPEYHAYEILALIEGGMLQGYIDTRVDMEQMVKKSFDSFVERVCV